MLVILPGCRRGSVGAPGPPVACASTRSRPCSVTWRAASMMRTRPVTITGLAASAPPDGLTSTSSPRPSASRRIDLLRRERRRQLGDLHRARRRARRLRAASVVDGDTVRSRMPGLVDVDAVVDAGDPRRPLDQRRRLVAGGEHDRGRAVGDRREVVARAAARARTARRAARRRRTSRSPARTRCRPRWRRLRATISAKSRSVALPASSSARACSAASDHGSRPSGARWYGSSCSG